MENFEQYFYDAMRGLGFEANWGDVVWYEAELVIQHTQSKTILLIMALVVAVWMICNIFIAFKKRKNNPLTSSPT